MAVNRSSQSAPTLPVLGVGAAGGVAGGVGAASMGVDAEDVGDVRDRRIMRHTNVQLVFGPNRGCLVYYLRLYRRACSNVLRMYVSAISHRNFHPIVC